MRAIATKKRKEKVKKGKDVASGKTEAFDRNVSRSFRREITSEYHSITRREIVFENTKIRVARVTGDRANYVKQTYGDGHKRRNSYHARIRRTRQVGKVNKRQRKNETLY